MRKQQVLNSKSINKELNSAVSYMIYQIREIYNKYEISFNVKNEYIHMIVMGIVSPSQLTPLKDSINHPYIISSTKNQLTSRLVHNQIITFPSKFYHHLSNATTTYTLSDHDQLGSMFENKNRNFDLEPKNAKSEAQLAVWKGNAALTEEQEEQLCVWIGKQKKKGKHVSSLRIQKKAREIALPKEITASGYWYQAFMKRHPEIKILIHQQFDPLQEVLVDSSSDSSSNQ